MPCMPAGACVKKATLGPASYETKTQQAINAQMPHTTLVAGDDAQEVLQYPRVLESQKT